MLASTGSPALASVLNSPCTFAPIAPTKRVGYLPASKAAIEMLSLCVSRPTKKLIRSSMAHLLQTAFGRHTSVRNPRYGRWVDATYAAWRP